ncbi:hypothetical protein [Nocardia jiangsuensis]|uniref:Tyr recombinase domain-containing protein n=1 Tax=Nocardia jiangsuensis TaxID=1691563 RepID=A0ABV8DZS3_9NOCA
MSGPHTDDLAAAELLLQRLGVSPEDLLDGRGERGVAPSFAEYVPVVLASMPQGHTRYNYAGYWRRILARPQWRDRRINEPTTTELQTLVLECVAARTIRATDRGGRGVHTMVVAALRQLYRAAEHDRIISRRHNPARGLDRPKTPPSGRRPLRNALLAEINRAAVESGHDPDLDSLLLRFHTETAARTASGLALRPRDVDVRWSQVLLREKAGRERLQPISPTLARGLVDFARERNVARGEPSRVGDRFPLEEDGSHHVEALPARGS